MAISSVNFQKAKSNSVAETTREFEANYLLPKEFRKENLYWNCGKTDQEVFNEELSKSNRKGGRVPKFENSTWEAVLNLNEEHSLEDVQKVAEHIEKKFNIKCTRIAVHRDEGKVFDDGEVKYNYHAHINFITYKDGKQNWRRELIRQTDLKTLQTEVANLLNMERGEFDSKSIRANHRELRKNYDEIIEQRQLAKQKDLKEEIKNLRKQLQEQKATRPEYAKLEALNRELKEQIKNKDLDLETLKKDIENFKNTNLLIQETNNLLEKQVINQRETISVQKTTNDTLKNDLKLSNANNEVLEQENIYFKNFFNEVGQKLGIRNTFEEFSDFKYMCKKIITRLFGEDETPQQEFKHNNLLNAIPGETNSDTETKKSKRKYKN